MQSGLVSLGGTGRDDISTQFASYRVSETSRKGKDRQIVITRSSWRGGSPRGDCWVSHVNSDSEGVSLDLWESLGNGQTDRLSLTCSPWGGGFLRGDCWVSHANSEP